MTMKRLTAIFMMILYLIPFSSSAEDKSALFPIRENGLWGYMNRAGETVIAPQWSDATGFRGGYAIARPAPPDPGMDPEDICGIINTDGEWVIPPDHWEILEKDNWGQYIGGRDEGIYIFFSSDPHQKEKYAGFFDIPSGFWSGMRYEWVDGDWIGDVDKELVCVTLNDLKGFVRRTTGELIIPCRYDPFLNYYFESGYCSVLPNDTDVTDGWILIDRTGREIPMPEGCYLTGHLDSTEDGLIPVWQAFPEKEHPDEEGLCGYMDLKGNLVIRPQYTWAYSFHEDLACVMLDSEREQTAVINPENEIVAILPDPVNRSGSNYCFNNGMLQLAHYSDENRLAYIAFLNHRCEETFRLEVENLYYAGDFLSNGTALYYTGKETPYGTYEDEGCGLFSPEKGILTGPIFAVRRDDDTYANFSEGLLPLADAETGKVGFIDDSGRWVIAPEWDSAKDFRNGLALVEKDDKMIYIDHNGFVVWAEP